jgi:hypothetical protein
MRPALPPEVEQTRKGCPHLVGRYRKTGCSRRRIFSQISPVGQILALGTGQILADFWAVQMKFPRHLTSPH